MHWKIWKNLNRIHKIPNIDLLINFHPKDRSLQSNGLFLLHF